jgi:predicted 3-demethylubiquinone-9 3-methyltransferase (glyoxalase superfamily)
MATITKIVPCLWFDDQAEDAAKFYVSVFESSRITRITNYGNAGQNIHGMKPGTVMTVAFDLAGQSFTALNGGPHFKFSEAISLQVMCDTQDELDRYWLRLSQGGDETAQQCGWLKDKFGLSWQIVPKLLPQMVADPDQARADRVVAAMLKMKKLDIAVLERAYKAKGSSGGVQLGH